MMAFGCRGRARWPSVGEGRRQCWMMESCPGSRCCRSWSARSGAVGRAICWRGAEPPVASQALLWPGHGALRFGRWFVAAGVPWLGVLAGGVRIAGVTGRCRPAPTARWRSTRGRCWRSSPSSSRGTEAGKRLGVGRRVAGQPWCRFCVWGNTEVDRGLPPLPPSERRVTVAVWPGTLRSWRVML